MRPKFLASSAFALFLLHSLSAHAEIFWGKRFEVHNPNLPAQNLAVKSRLPLSQLREFGLLGEIERLKSKTISEKVKVIHSLTHHLILQVNDSGEHSNRDRLRI